MSRSLPKTSVQFSNGKFADDDQAVPLLQKQRTLNGRLTIRPEESALLQGPNWNIRFEFENDNSNDRRQICAVVLLDSRGEVRLADQFRWQRAIRGLTQTDRSTFTIVPRLTKSNSTGRFTRFMMGLAADSFRLSSPR